MLMQPWWVSILTAVAGAVVVGFLALWRQRISDWHHRSTRLEAEIFGRSLDAISELAGSEGMRRLLRFFSDSSTPKEMLDYLQRVSSMDNDLREFKEELSTLRGMLWERLFNPVTARIHEGIESNKTFSQRLGEKSDSKMYLRDHWLDVEIVQHVLAKEESIFVESGSTLAYCMLSVIDRFGADFARRKPLRVCTNNVAIYMMLLFQEGFRPVLLNGRPNNPYAATFGDIDEDGRHGHAIAEFLEKNKVNVLFTTASYLDIDYGPHVSSVQNHAMKRILNDYANASNERKNIFVIVAEKINRGVMANAIRPECKLIFDPNRRENIADDADALEEISSAWRAHVEKDGNYLISGSSNPALSTSELEDFARRHGMGLLKSSPGNGLLLKLPSA